MTSLAAIVALAAIAFNPGWPSNDPQLPPDAYSRIELMPDDPAYPPQQAQTTCAGQHELYGFVPDCLRALSAEDGAVGIAADRAWAWTTGRPDVVVAIAADGVDWGDPDVVSRWRLDAGELGPPVTSTSAMNVHDRNGDGLFNVQDFTTATGTATPTVDRVIDRRLLARTDRGDVNGNGLLDPQDLIRIFSDGVDDDDDGYVDDIAGWDHLDDDNDAGVPLDASPHARWIVATANNQIGGVGVCPSCAAMPMRIGDRGRSRAHVLSMAILYAVDEGASVLGMFTAAIEPTSFLAEAVDYAFENGRLIVATAGTHGERTRPVAWNPDRVLIVGGVGFDALDNRAATTALAPDPCSGFGPQLAVVAPSRCDERGAALAAGTAGLVFSAARGIVNRGVPPVDPPLAASEALQILTTTARPRGPDENASRGWEERAGYGRIDARQAVDAVVRRRIPPRTNITGPAWYSVEDPTLRDAVSVTATILNPRIDAVSWSLQAATGVEPAPDAFTTLASGRLVAGRVADIEAELSTAGLFADSAGRPVDYGDFAVTIRMTTRASVGSEVVSAEVRRVFFVHRDLDLLPAFPIRLQSGVVAAPRIMDVDGDGDLEIVVATVDGMLRVINRFGEIVGGEIRTSPSPRVRAHNKSVAFVSGAVQSDVAQTIVAPLSGLAQATPLVFIQTTVGAVLAAAADGQVTTVASSSTAPGAAPAGATSTPTIVDLDGDGKMDVIHTRNGDVFAEDIDGRVLAGWPATVEGVAGTPSVGDVDADGETEVVIVTRAAVTVFGSTGVVERVVDLEPGVRINARTPVYAPSAAIGDVDLDGKLDIVVAVEGHPLRIITDTGVVEGSSARSFPQGSDVARLGPPLFAANGHATIAALLGGLPPRPFVPLAAATTFAGLAPDTSHEAAVGAFEIDGTFRIGFPRRSAAPGPLDALVADLDGDRRAEIVWPESGDRLRAIAFDGSRPRRFPKLTGDEVVGTPTIEDIDRDGFLDLVAATRTGQVFVWRTRGPADGRVGWSGYHHDLRATGNLTTAAFAREKINTTGGCACRHSNAVHTADFVLVILFGLWFVRRRT